MKLPTKAILIIVIYLQCQTTQKSLKEQNLCLEDKKKITEIEKNFKESNLIGSGSFGKIYSHQNFAWKVIEVENDESEAQETERDLAGELRSMKFFEKNNNIMRYYEKECYYKSASNSFKAIFKMDLMQGDLWNLLWEEKNVIKKNLFWKFDMLYKLANALKELNNNYIHRDLKPENIMMLNKYIPIIGDLGEAINLEDISESNSIVGTYPYIAPEIYWDDINNTNYYEGATYSDKSDIYSLGGIFYSIITNFDCKFNKVIDVSEEESGELEESEEESDETDYYFENENPEYYFLFFEDLVTAMTSEEIDKRPHIDVIITHILSILPKLIDYDNKNNKKQINPVVKNPALKKLVKNAVNKAVDNSSKDRIKNLMNYLNEEEKELNKMKINKNDLINDFKIRKQIYERFMNEKDIAGIQLFDNKEFSEFVGKKKLI